MTKNFKNFSECYKKKFQKKLKFLKNFPQCPLKSLPHIHFAITQQLKAKFCFCSQHRIIKINLCRSGSQFFLFFFTLLECAIMTTFLLFREEIFFLSFSFQDLSSHTVNYYCMVKCAEKGEKNKKIFFAFNHGMGNYQNRS